MVKTREEILRAVSDIYPAGGWILLCCSKEYEKAPEIVYDYVKVKNELDYDPGEPRLEEDSRMFEGMRVWGRERSRPGDGKVFVLGEKTDRNDPIEIMARDDPDLKEMITEKKFHQFLFFGEIDEALMELVREHADHTSLFFMDIEGDEIKKHCTHIKYARPDLADPQYLSPGWISSIRSDYWYYYYSSVSTVPEPQPVPQPVPLPLEKMPTPEEITEQKKKETGLIKALNDLYPPGGWIMVSLSEEYSWVSPLVSNFIDLKNQMDYDPGEEPPQRPPSMWHDVPLRPGARPIPGDGKFIVLGDETIRDRAWLFLALTDHYFTWLATESTIEMFMFFGEIHGELAAMINGFPENFPLFFMGVSNEEILKHFPQLKAARPVTAGTQSSTSGWFSSVGDNYVFYSYAVVSDPSLGSRKEERLRKRALRYDPQYQQ